MKFLILSISICICGLFAFSPNTTTVSNKTDYEHLLSNDGDEEIFHLEKEFTFWSSKFDKSPNQYPYLLKMAEIKNALFQQNGQIEHLVESTELLESANTKINSSDAAILRTLAKNYISEHRFDESLEKLIEAQKLGVGLLETEKMLFDVYMELGNYNKAEYYLNNPLYGKNSFDFLIRKSKWADHKGHLKEAIFYLNQALKAAESARNDELVQWALTNLADYYGHDGNIQKSYEHFLKALEIDPSNAYAKKGIAWIVYSHERNPKEALRILEAIETYHHSPNTTLLKAEIAEYTGETSVKEELVQDYFNKLSNNQAYEKMYNAYNVVLYADNELMRQKALEIAKLEVDMRPTPSSYSLLAWAHYKIGNIEEAKFIFTNQVQNKTYEPEPLLLMSQVLAQDLSEVELDKVKNELSESLYELGPMAQRVIAKL